MLQLFQAEWCPWSRRVRHRLTELGIDYVNRQVPVDQSRRAALVSATGASTIPALVLENGSAIVGAENILAFLGEFEEAPDLADAHREKAELKRREYLEHACGCAHSAH